MKIYLVSYANDNDELVEFVLYAHDQEEAEKLARQITEDRPKEVSEF